MTVENYQKVICKLILEMAFLYLVDLYIWGEPLLNPNLPEIIRINSSLGIASGISSNLNAGKNLEEVIKAGPAQIRVSLSGYGPKHYEVTHPGGNWAVLKENLIRLSEYIKKYDTKTIVEVYYHANKSNCEEYPQAVEFCTELGFRVAPSIHMVFPNFAMQYLEGKTLDDKNRKAVDLMIVSFDQMLEQAKKEQQKTCLLKRCLPVINWDMKVLVCCNMLPDAVLVPNYLDTSLEQIIELRNESPVCEKCQKYSLHRYFQPLLYTDIVNKKFPPHL